MKKAMSFSEISLLLTQRFHEAKNLYIDRDFTAKQLAEHFQVLFSANFQKACFVVLGPKGKGHGGARLGAGNDRLGREKRKLKKSSYRTIAVMISPENMAYMQSRHGFSHADTINTALDYFRRVTEPLDRKIVELEE